MLVMKGAWVSKLGYEVLVLWQIMVHLEQVTVLLCASVFFFFSRRREWWGRGRHSITSVILEPGHRVGRWLINHIAHRILSKLYCGILFLPNTSLASFHISHGPPSLWSHLTLPSARPSLYLLCFCFIYPISINRNFNFSGSSLNSTSFMKTVLNLIPVLPHTLPAQARVYVYFLLWSRDRVYMPLMVLNVGTKDSETLLAREIRNYGMWTPAWTCWCRASAFSPSLPTVSGIFHSRGAAHKFRSKSMHIFSSSLL